MTGWITLSAKELPRVHVIEKLIAGELRISDAARILDLSQRHIKRLKKGVMIHGHAFLAHKNRGRKPKHAVPQHVSQTVISLATGSLKGASCQHIAELLAEHHDIHLSARTVRRILQRAGVPNPLSHKPPRRRRCRSRMPQEGLLVQCDASPFDWLEGRGPILALHGIVDDATGKVLGLHFRLQEDLTGYMHALYYMLQHFGIPHSLYSDGHSIFFSPKHHELSIEDQLAGKASPLSQFGEMLSQLGITHIRARSPQAKGRIERLWQTLQIRLVIELRIAGICTLEQANAFLPSFIRRFNQLFAVQPANPQPAFRPAPPPELLNSIIATREYRSASNGSTIAYHGNTYQLLSNGSVVPLPNRARVTVLSHLDGSISALFDGKRFSLRQLALPAPVERQRQASPKQPKSKAHKPAPNHPWRNYGHRAPEDPVQDYFDRKLRAHLLAGDG